MAHPDHDQVIGRLVGARLRGAADGRPVSDAAAEAHPDAEAWAAYLDGGLRADDVVRLETHLAGCPVCRRLLAVLAPEVSADAAPAVREVDTPAAGGGVVIPFPRRQVFAWMAAAAGLLMAVTLWSVSWLGNPSASNVAMSTPQTGAPLEAPPAPPPADSAAKASRPPARLEDGQAVDRVAGRAPTVEERSAAQQEQDKLKMDARSYALTRRQPAEFGAFDTKPVAQAPAVPAGSERNIQLQANTAAAGARQRGPLVSQQANQQAGNQPQHAQVAEATQPPALASSPTPPAKTAAAQAPPAVAGAPPAPAAAPAAPTARADAAAATRERRANEPLAESAVTTSSAGARPASPPEPERRQATGADREGQALSKDEAARRTAFGYVSSASALPSFAEPGGRLRWRIADGRRLESSSDGGTTWSERYTAIGDRLRAGTAPSIDSAWAVGERGLVLRLTVSGGWTAVSRPVEATLTAVSATGAQAARVTADDGRVFETADGGATWTQVSPGAGPR
jgi:Putative zinc-finger